MTNFEKACLLSCEEWVNTLSTIDDFQFSKSYERKMKKLFNKMRNDKYHRFTTNTVKVLVAAAIIMSIATTAFAIPTTREYIFNHFKNYAVYTVADVDKAEQIEPISVGYLPDGFVQNYEDSALDRNTLGYENGAEWIKIDKYRINSSVFKDNEYNNYETVQINGVDYICSVNDDGNTEIIWNNGEYVYSIYSSLNMNNLLTIAENLK